MIRPIVKMDRRWMLASIDEKTLKRWECKILKNNYGTVLDNGEWRIGINK